MEEELEGIKAMAKWKAVLARRKTFSGVGTANIGRRVQQRRGLARLLDSISSNLEGVVVIPDGDVQQSNRNEGAFK